MALDIVQCDLDSHRDLLISAVYRLLTPLSNPRRFEWLYKNGPHGQARAWQAREASGGELVGVGVAFPRIYRVAGQKLQAWVLGDFCLNPRFRSLGPALEVQRACLTALESSNAAFVYDFPSAAMAAIYGRLKIIPTQRFIRWAKPLRIDRFVRQRVSIPGVRELMSFAGNLCLRSSRMERLKSSFTITHHERCCDQEFGELADEVAADGVPRIDRSAEYLNWRYWDNPTAHFKLVTVRQNGRLRGYAVYSVVRDDATIVDLVGILDGPMVKALVNYLSRQLADAGIQTLNAPLSEYHPWTEVLRELGFRERESSPIVVVGSGRTRSPVGQLDRIPFMQGDRDS